MQKAKFKIGRSSNNIGTFKDAEMDWFFKRTLEYTNSGGADIGDCLSIVDKINDVLGNVEQWICGSIFCDRDDSGSIVGES